MLYLVCRVLTNHRWDRSCSSLDLFSWCFSSGYRTVWPAHKRKQSLPLEDIILSILYCDPVLAGRSGNSKFYTVMKWILVAKTISKPLGGYCNGVYCSCEDNLQGLARIPLRRQSVSSLADTVRVYCSCEDNWQGLARIPLRRQSVSSWADTVIEYIVVAKTIGKILPGFHPACYFVWLQVLFLCCIIYIKVRHYLEAILLGLGPLLGQIRTRILRHDKGGWMTLAWDNIDFLNTSLLKDLLAAREVVSPLFLETFLARHSLI